MLDYQLCYSLAWKSCDVRARVELYFRALPPPPPPQPRCELPSPTAVMRAAPPPAEISLSLSLPLSPSLSLSLCLSLSQSRGAPAAALPAAGDLRRGGGERAGQAGKSRGIAGGEQRAPFLCGSE